MSELATSYWIAGLLALIAGVGYAALLYFRHGQGLSPLWHRVLALLRFTLVFIIVWLLFAPLLKRLINQTEAAEVLVLVDNSQSIGLTRNPDQQKAFLSRLGSMQKTLEEGDLKVRFLDFSGRLYENLASVRFTHPSSDLSKLVASGKLAMESRNAVAMVLVSDGIHNLGASPEYQVGTMPIYSLGIGDSLPRNDIAIAGLAYNKVAFRNNRFQLLVDVSQRGFAGKTVQVKWKENNQVLDSKSLVLGPDGSIQNVFLESQSAQSGMHRYEIEVDWLQGDVFKPNNKAQAYIEILDNRQRVHILAAAPHPDIKALTAALQSQEQYEVSQEIKGLHPAYTGKVDVLIALQLPDYGKSFDDRLKAYANKGIPIVYVLGNGTDIRKFSAENTILSIQTPSNQKDEARAARRSGFEKFNLSNEDWDLLESLPPLTVPFGTYTLKGEYEVWMQQQIGRVKTERPLIVLAKDRSMAVIAGEGLFAWRLDEYRKTQAFTVFDSQVANLVQWLASKNDKRRFKVYPKRESYFAGESVRLEAEVYNEVYERVFGQEISLNLKGEKASYTYVFQHQERNSGIDLNGLAPGRYTYTAKTSFDNQALEVKGEFMVREYQLEERQLQADFNLLRRVSKANGATFLPIEQSEDMTRRLLASDFKKRINSSEEWSEWIDHWWIMVVLILLASLEWFTRRYQGIY
jgi:hypothetical protein